MAVVIYRSNNKVELTLTKRMAVVNQVVTYYETKHPEKATRGVVTDDPAIIDYLFQKKYTRAFRTWRYWNIEDKPWFNEFNQKVDALKLGSVQSGTYGFKTMKNEVNPNLVAETDDAIEILPGMNLGLQSPID